MFRCVSCTIVAALWFSVAATYRGIPILDGITGDEDAVVLGRLNKSVILSCMVYGYPSPGISWEHQGVSVVNDTVYAMRGNMLDIKRLSIEALGRYTCHAYNGTEKTASWVMLVRAYPAEDTVIEHNNLLPQVRILTTSSTMKPITTGTRNLTEIAFCFFEIDQGPCSGAGQQERYAYDSKLGKCVAFQYSGCGGNMNNFPDKEFCSSFCHPVQETVSQGECEDNAFFANCDIVVSALHCNHKYYSKFCCKSCKEAGML